MRSTKQSRARARVNPGGHFARSRVQGAHSWRDDLSVPPIVHVLEYASSGDRSGRARSRWEKRRELAAVQNGVKRPQSEVWSAATWRRFAWRDLARLYQNIKVRKPGGTTSPATARDRGTRLACRRANDSRRTGQPFDRLRLLTESPACPLKPRA
jgi:hypothetical protein